MLEKGKKNGFRGEKLSTFTSQLSTFLYLCGVKAQMNINGSKCHPTATLSRPTRNHF
jgi:hypothetical protein